MRLHILSLVFAVLCGSFGLPAKTVKLKITESGVYQLTAKELASLGFSAPEKVALVGFPTTVLAFNEFHNLPGYTGSHVQPTIVTDDGRLLFYAGGAKDYRMTSYRSAMKVENLYSLYNCYFLTDETAPVRGKRNAVADEEDGDVFSTHYCLQWLEDEVQNPENAGSVLHGYKVQEGQEFPVQKFPTKGYIPSTTAYYYGTYAGKSEDAIKVTAEFDSRYWRAVSKSHHVIDEVVSLTGIYNIGYNLMAVNSLQTEIPDTLQVSHSYKGYSEIEYLAPDYSYLIYNRHNLLTDSMITMHIPDVNSSSEVAIFGGNGIKTEVWQIDNGLNVSRLEVKSKKIDIEGDENFVDAEVAVILPSAPIGATKAPVNPAIKVIAFNPERHFPSPEIVGEVPVEMLKCYSNLSDAQGIDGKIPEMIAISSREFLPFAQELADIHRELRGEEVSCVAVEDLYEAYSSGTPHANAIRIYLKELYDKGKDKEGKSKLKAVLLYGAGVWDNRLITLTGQNLLPTYQTEDPNCLKEYTKIFGGDAFFGLLEENFDNTNLLYQYQTIAVGRIPVRDPQYCRDVNEKIRKHLSNLPDAEEYARTIIVTDQGDYNEHLKQGEKIAEIIGAKQPESIFYKGYCQIYPVNGNKSEEVRKLTSSALKKGVGTWFIGAHGDHHAFGAYQLWNNDLVKATKYERYPLVFASSCGTCDFDLRNNSIGETMVKIPGGGAIGVISTSRSVYLTYNGVISNAFYDELMKSAPGESYGEIYRRARNAAMITASEDLAANNWCFNYVGDPLIPSGGYTHKLNASVSENPRVLKPFEISGTVLKAEGGADAAFNGKISAVLLDRQRVAKTYRFKNDDAPLDSVTLDEDILAVKTGEIKDGKFRIEMVSPAFRNDTTEARLCLYATSTDGMSRAALQISDFTLVEGTGEPCGKGPEITLLAVGGDGFTEGCIVPSNTRLMADIRPGEAGILMGDATLKSGVELVIDGVRSQAVSRHLLRFTADGMAHINAPLENLGEGLHNITFTVTGADFQQSSRSISFNVADGSGLPAPVLDQNVASDEVTVSMPEGFLSSGSSLPEYGRCFITVTNAELKEVLRVDPVALPYTLDLKQHRSEIPLGEYRVRIHFAGGDGVKGGFTTPSASLRVVPLD